MRANNTIDEHALKKGALEAKLHARCQTFNGKSLMSMFNPNCELLSSVAR